MRFRGSMLAVCLALTAPAMGAEWTGLGDGTNWNDGDNWASGFPPLTSEYVEIATGNPVHSGDLLRAADTLVTGAGNLTVNGRFRNGDGGPATFTFSSNGTLTVNGNYFMAGRTAPSTFHQTSGTVNVNLDRGFFVSDGSGATGSTLRLSGGTMYVNMYGDYNELHNVRIGKEGDPTKKDLFLIDGGTFIVENNKDGNGRRFYIEGNARFQVDSGSATISNFQYLIVGRKDGSDQVAEMIINGGSVSASLTALVVGGFNDGLLEVNGGSLTLTAGDLWIADSHPNRKGDVIQIGGIIDIAGNVVVGREVNAIGSYTMSGGQLIASNIVLGNGIGTFNFNGGQIILDGDRTDILNEIWFNAVAGTFATYNAQTNTTLIAVPEPASLALVGLGGLMMLRRRTVS